MSCLLEHFTGLQQSESRGDFVEVNSDACELKVISTMMVRREQEPGRPHRRLQLWIFPQ